MSCAAAALRAGPMRCRGLALRAGPALLIASLAACAPDSGVLAPTEESLLYDREYPAIAYREGDVGGRIARVAAGLGSGPVAAASAGARGRLDTLLAALDIDASSQTLVYSRTSKQTGFIRPDTPRAIYFNDDTYVAWTPGAPTIEIASFDPALGPTFFTLAQDASAPPVLERHLGTCLRCHDTYGLSGGGVPRFLLGSGYTGTNGELVSHEAWILTDQTTPLRFRWGGWYVTGQHGAATHLGNIVVERAEDLQDLEALRVANVDELDSLFATSDYPTPYSDIVALLVLEHQVDVQNRIARLRFETVGRLAGDGDGDGENVDAAALDRLVEPLLRAMLMEDEAPLADRISGGSGFSAHFESLGPFDSAGRSLRSLELSPRLFRYPLSYLIYSEAFQALPDAVRAAFYARLRAILEAGPGSDDFAWLTGSDRAAIASILAETLPEALGP